MSTPISGAVLLEDRGERAASADFFRCPSFLGAEGVTHTMLIETKSGCAALPLIVRNVPGTTHRDAISPYGYPGGLVEGRSPDPRAVDLSALGLVSVFVRDRLGEPTLVGGTIRARVLVYDPAVPRAVSKSYRRDVRRNVERGYLVEPTAGRDVEEDDLVGFATAYTETMQHVGAVARYLFDLPYLRACLDAEGSWLVVARDTDGEVAAGELVVTSDGVLHSYLAGTRTHHRPVSPGKNVTLCVLDLADELGMRVNMGGGMVAADGIEASKLSYVNATDDFVTHELVADHATYALLGGPHGPTDYFPRYRAPATQS